MNLFPSLKRNSSFPLAQDPFRAMAKMQRDMDQMFNRFMRGEWDIDFPLSSVDFGPALNLEDMQSHYLLSIDVPGMKKSDIKLEIQDGQLHVSGERQQESEKKKKHGFESERFYGSFERWIALPPNSSPEGIEAKVEDGVLQVAIPKKEASKSTEIKIGDGKSSLFSAQIEKKPAA